MHDLQEWMKKKSAASDCVCVCVCLVYRYGGALQNLTLKLPVTINKFFQPTEMTSHDFFQRWKQLSQ